ncbi:HDOD domain-containing protein [Candidatus Eisenbacteria bacterium]|uniref:HDOD domain-containing protein n=1 Tax=Eiseniibacteriota bacterium TaxID=2212470 RepID=A0ABV6YI34_UNCEI
MLTVRETLQQKLQSIAYLPTMPHVLLNVQKALRDDNSAAGKIASIIREDPALTTSVLRVANSVMYRGKLSPKMSSIPQAVARIGFTEVNRICMASILVRAFDNYGKGVNHAEFWRHSLAVATTTGIFKKYTRKPELARNDVLDDAFTAGLLHDIGILAMDQFFPKLLAKVRSLAESEFIPLARAENEILGIEHGEIAGDLLASWNLPERVVDAVTWHHDPDRSADGTRRVTQMVHLADFICVNQSIGHTLEGLYDGFSAGAWHDLGLSIDQVPAMLEDLKEEEKRSQLLGGTS